MQKITFFLVYAALITTVLSSCNMFCEKGTGNPTTEIRNVLEFDEIDIYGQAIVFIEQGDKAKVEIEIDSNLLEFVQTKVSGMKLKIYDNKCFEDVSKYEIHIRIPNLTSLYVGGAADVKTEGIFTTDNLYIKVKDAANVRFDVETEDLETVTKDSGKLNLYGKSIDFELDVDDSGLVDAFSLISKNVDADIRDAGVCKVNVSGKFKGDVRDNGKIFYKGNPKKVKTNASDSGSIEAK